MSLTNNRFAPVSSRSRAPRWVRCEYCGQRTDYDAHPNCWACGAPVGLMDEGDDWGYPIGSSYPMNYATISSICVDDYRDLTKSLNRRLRR